MARYGVKTNLNRMFSSISAARNLKEKEELIAAQQYKKIKAGPFYSISSFEFNEKTRIAHIVFKQVDKYRKIERYVTVNYVRNPIYSDYWLSKEKNIKKTIKLSNAELENLPNNNDYLINNFRFEIVEKLGNEDLIPSWAIINSINKDKEILLEEEKKVLSQRVDELNSKNNANKSKKNQLLSIIKTKEFFTNKERKKYNLLKRKYRRTKNIFLSFISFGIYSYLLSKTHKNKLLSKIKKSEEKITDYEKIIADSNIQISNLDKCIADNNLKICEAKKTYNENCEAIQDKMLAMIAKVKPLETNIDNSEDFIPLKKLVGIDYQKVKGCYIIHNKEKDKYYVGQSKDVLSVF